MKNIVLAVILLTAGCLNFLTSGQTVENSITEVTVREFTPVSLDEATAPVYNYQRANKLPMTGYFWKSFIVNGNTRTAKFYIAASAPIRTFFTVIAVPEDIGTIEFMVSSGWQTIADENEEGLVLLEPGKEGWGDPATEQEYINAVINFYKNNSYFSIFGISYLIGYDDGGTALEVWASANPLFVISQAYVNSESGSDAYYSCFSTMYLDGLSSGYIPIEIPDEIKIHYDQVPIPTAYINSDLSHVSSGISYWKKVNDAEAHSTSSPDYLFGADVFTQSAESALWATAYTDPISKVITLEKLARYLTDYYNVDPSRFYATGQSAGSFAAQGFGVTNPEYFAAIASTSGLSYPSDGGGIGRTLYRAHNCIPAEMPRLWDYMKHWSYKNGIRYYDGLPVK